MSSYEEQTIDKLERYIKPYNGYIQSRYGFSIDDALKFILHLRELCNQKLTDSVRPFAETYSYYTDHPDEWQKLTSSFIERGINDPQDWWEQPELKGMLSTLTTNPGEVLLHNAEELMSSGLDETTTLNLIDFFSFDKDYLSGKTAYYAESHYSESHPFIKVGESYVCLSKFLFESLYFRLDEELKNSEKKYKQNKDSALEVKVAEVFTHFFPKAAKIFTNYSVDGVSENDLLIVVGSTCIVVEVKNCKFREPFRSPLKAYDRVV